MKHLYAQKGIKLIYISMILMVGSEVFEMLESFMESQLFNSHVAGLICKVIAALLLLSGVVMQIVGLGYAKKDDKGYKKAFIIGISGFIFVIIISIGQSILDSMLAMDIAIISNISKLVYSVMSLIVDYQVIKTTIQLLERNHFEEQAEIGGKIWKTILILFLTAMILGLVAGSFLSITDYYDLNNANTVAALFCFLLEIVMGILEIIAYAKYRKYLKHIYSYL